VAHRTCRTSERNKDLRRKEETRKDGGGDNDECSEDIRIAKPKQGEERVVMDEENGLQDPLHHEPKPVSCNIALTLRLEEVLNSRIQSAFELRVLRDIRGEVESGLLDGYFLVLDEER
jgi:hypothetical protein